MKTMFLLSMRAASPKSAAESFHSRILILSCGSRTSSIFIILLSMPTKTFSWSGRPFMLTSRIPSIVTNLPPSIDKVSTFGPAVIDPPAHIRRAKGAPGDWRGSVPSGRSLFEGIMGLLYTRWWPGGRRVLADDGNCLLSGIAVWMKGAREMESLRD